MYLVVMMSSLSHRLVYPRRLSAAAVLQATIISSHSNRLGEQVAVIAVAAMVVKVAKRAVSLVTITISELASYLLPLTRLFNHPCEFSLCSLFFVSSPFINFPVLEIDACSHIQLDFDVQQEYISK